MKLCPHCSNPVQGAYRPLSDEDAKALRSRGTATDTQEARIVAALRTGPKTTDDLRKLGIYQASARIFGLRERGFVVSMTPFSGYSADGYSHARMALYKLESEPEESGEGKRARQGPQRPVEGANGGEAACNPH